MCTLWLGYISIGKHNVCYVICYKSQSLFVYRREGIIPTLKHFHLWYRTAHHVNDIHIIVAPLFPTKWSALTVNLYQLAASLINTKAMQNSIKLCNVRSNTFTLCTFHYAKQRHVLRVVPFSYQLVCPFYSETTIDMVFSVFARYN